LSQDFRAPELGKSWVYTGRKQNLEGGTPEQKNLGLTSPFRAYKPVSGAYATGPLVPTVREGFDFRRGLLLKLTILFVHFQISSPRGITSLNIQKMHRMYGETQKRDMKNISLQIYSKSKEAGKLKD